MYQEPPPQAEGGTFSCCPWGGAGAVMEEAGPGEMYLLPSNWKGAWGWVGLEVGAFGLPGPRGVMPAFPGMARPDQTLPSNAPHQPCGEPGRGWWLMCECAQLASSKGCTQSKQLARV